MSVDANFLLDNGTAMPSVRAWLESAKSSVWVDCCMVFVAVPYAPLKRMREGHLHARKG